MNTCNFLNTNFVGKSSKISGLLMILLIFISFDNAVGQDNALKNKDVINIIFKDGSVFKQAVLLHQDSLELFVYHNKLQHHILKIEIDFVEESKLKLGILATGGGAHLVGLGVGIFFSRAEFDFSLLPIGFAIGGKLFFDSTLSEKRWKKYAGASISTFELDFFGKSKYSSLYVNLGVHTTKDGLFLSFDTGVLLVDQTVGATAFMYPTASINVGLFLNRKNRKIRF